MAWIRTQVTGKAPLTAKNPWMMLRKSLPKCTGKIKWPDHYKRLVCAVPSHFSRSCLWVLSCDGWTSGMLKTCIQKTKPRTDLTLFALPGYRREKQNKTMRSSFSMQLSSSCCNNIFHVASKSKWSPQTHTSQEVYSHSCLQTFARFLQCWNWIPQLQWDTTLTVVTSSTDKALERVWGASHGRARVEGGSGCPLLPHQKPRICLPARERGKPLQTLGLPAWAIRMCWGRGAAPSSLVILTETGHLFHIASQQFKEQSCA